MNKQIESVTNKISPGAFLGTKEKELEHVSDLHSQYFEVGKRAAGNPFNEIFNEFRKDIISEILYQFPMRMLDGNISEGNSRAITPIPSGFIVRSNSVSRLDASDPGEISETQYVEAARMLECEAASFKAVVMTEIGVRKPFDSQGRPAILFERHYFSKFTGGKFDKPHPDLSNPVPGGYGRFSDQYTKLERAMTLDKNAALRSASWGAFQIMGNNYRQAGFGSIDSFVKAMKASAQMQMTAFVHFVKNDPLLLNALQQKDWDTFAKKYNGPAYEANQYNTKMRDNYNKIVNDE